MEKDKPDAQLNREKPSLAQSSKLKAQREKSLRDTGLSLWFDPHSKPWIKVVACIVIAAFLHQDVVWAAGTDYTDDIKHMLQQPAERVIERLGMLFSIKNAYAFEPYYGGGSGTLSGQAYTDYGSSVQQITNQSQVNPYTGIGYDWGVSHVSFDDYNQPCVTPTFNLGEANNHITDPSITQTINGLNKGTTTFTDSNQYSQTLQRLGQMSDQLVTQGVQLTPNQQTPFSFSAPNGSGSYSNTLYVHAQADYNPQEACYKMWQSRLAPQPFGMWMREIGTDKNNLQPVPRNNFSQLTLGAFVGHPQTLVMEADRLFPAKGANNDFQFKPKAFSRQGISLVLPITPNNYQANLNSNKQLNYTYNNSVNSGTNSGPVSYKLEGAKGLDTWQEPGSVQLETGTFGIDVANNSAWGIANVNQEIVLDTAKVNAGLNHYWLNNNAVKQNAAELQPQAFGKNDPVLDYRSFVRAWEQNQYDLSSTADGDLKVNNGRMRVLNSVPQPGLGDRFFANAKDAHLIDFGSDAGISSLEITSHPEAKKYEGIIGRINKGIGAVPTTGTWNNIGRVGTIELNANGTALKGNTATILDNYIQAQHSPGLTVEHRDIKDVFIAEGSALARQISAKRGPIATYKSNGKEWNDISLADKVVVSRSTIDGNRTTAAQLSLGVDGLIEGRTNDWAYHSQVLPQKIDVHKNQIDNQDQSMHEDTSGSASKWQTKEISPYVYESTSNTSQHAFNLDIYNQDKGVKLYTSQSIDSSPMLSNVQHAFSEPMDRFTVGMQVFDDGSIGGELYYKNESGRKLTGVNIDKQGFSPTKNVVKVAEGIHTQMNYHENDTLVRSSVANVQEAVLRNRDYVKVAGQAGSGDTIAEAQANLKDLTIGKDEFGNNRLYSDASGTPAAPSSTSWTGWMIST
jgi:hypothetical protein